jgi:hypothetical protein
VEIGEMLFMQNFDPYQVELLKKFEKFRPPYLGAAYPPYHKGMYLEEYFFHQFLNAGKVSDKILIPIFWTNCYLSGTTDGLQELLNSLDPEREYFCVSQHDDAIKEKLPPKTIHFNAGGNITGHNVIPIPLVCSRIPNNYTDVKKTTFCSFVGSNTHPIRKKMIEELSGKSGFEIYAKEWSPQVKSEDQSKFLSKTAESMFSLCPRGYGASSFRTYEALQLGAVPVIIYDHDWRPFKQRVNWDNFSVHCHYSRIKELPDALVRLAPYASNMAIDGKYCYDKFFSLHSLTDQIYIELDARKS